MQIANNTLEAVETYYVSSLSPLIGEREAELTFQLVTHSILGLSKLEIRLLGGRRLSESQLVEYIHVLKDLKRGKPVQYALGTAHFLGNDFKVTPDTLIPRPETEELVDWVVRDLGNGFEGAIVDVGTGSGCIAISVKQFLSKAKVYGLDVSSKALAVAKENNTSLGSDVQFIHANILNEVPSVFTKDITIVSNPPYIGHEEAKEMESHVLDYEPAIALFPDGDDPLVFYKKLAKIAQQYDATLFVEINQAYGKEVQTIFDTFGAKKIELRQDLSGKDRMVKGLW